MKKVLFGLSLGLATIGACFADAWSHTQGNSGVYQVSVSVPSAGTCYQYGAAYYGAGMGSSIYNAGPLGAYTRYPGDPALNVTGSVTAGNYVITQVVNYSGYSGTVLTW